MEVGIWIFFRTASDSPTDRTMIAMRKVSGDGET